MVGTAAASVRQLRRKGVSEETFDRMLEIVRREGDGAFASRHAGALRLLEKIWHSGVDVVTHEAMLELNEVASDAPYPEVAPLWTFPSARDAGVGGDFYKYVFCSIFDILGDEIPSVLNLPMPERPRYAGEPSSGIPRANRASLLSHGIRYWPWAVPSMLLATQHSEKDVQSAFTQLLTWDLPAQAGKRTWPCSDARWIGAYQTLIRRLLAPPHSILPRNWESPTAMGWYFEVHQRDPHLDNAPTSGWNATTSFDDDGIEFVEAVLPDEDWLKDAAKTSAAIDVDNPVLADPKESRKCGLVKDEDEKEEELPAATASDDGLVGAGSVTECGSEHGVEDEDEHGEAYASEADDGEQRLAAAEAMAHAVQRARARMQRFFRFPVLVSRWWKAAQWRRDGDNPQLVHGHIRFRVYIKDPLQLELERIASYAVELFPGIRKEVSRLQYHNKYLVPTRIERIQNLIDRSSEFAERAEAARQRRLHAAAAAKERDEQLQQQNGDTDPDVPITRQRRGVTRIEFVCSKNHAAVKTRAACNGHCSRCAAVIVAGAQIIECKGCLPNAVPWWACQLCEIHFGYDPDKPVVRKSVLGKDNSRAFDPGPEVVYSPRKRPKVQEATEPVEPVEPVEPTEPPPWANLPSAHPIPTTLASPIDVSDTEMVTEDLIERVFSIEVHLAIDGDVTYEHAYVMHYRINNVTSMQRLINDVLKRIGLTAGLARFVLDGTLITSELADDLAENMGMYEGSIVDVILPEWCAETQPRGLHVYRCVCGTTPLDANAMDEDNDLNDPNENGSVDLDRDADVDMTAEAPVQEPAQQQPAQHEPYPAGCKRTNPRFSYHQLKQMELMYFNKSKRYPTIEERQALADELNLKTHQITGWFQKRRTRDRRAQEYVTKRFKDHNDRNPDQKQINTIADSYGVQWSQVSLAFAMLREQNPLVRTSSEAPVEPSQSTQATETATPVELSNVETFLSVKAPLGIKSGDRVEWEVQDNIGRFSFVMPDFPPTLSRPTLTMSVFLNKKFDNAPQGQKLKVVNVRINGEGSSAKPIALDDSDSESTAKTPATEPTPTPQPELSDGRSDAAEADGDPVWQTNFLQRLGDYDAVFSSRVTHPPASVQDMLLSVRRSNAGRSTVVLGMTPLWFESMGLPPDREGCRKHASKVLRFLLARNAHKEGYALLERVRHEGLRVHFWVMTVGALQRLCDAARRVKANELRMAIGAETERKRQESRAQGQKLSNTLQTEEEQQQAKELADNFEGVSEEEIAKRMEIITSDQLWSALNVPTA